MLIVDASVALKWFKAEPDSGLADRVAEAHVLLAPELVVAEICNAGWNAARRGLMTPPQLQLLADLLPRYFAALFSLSPLAKRATEAALQLDHPIYDCFYLALAEREAAALVTADRRLLAKVAGTPWASLARNLASFAS